MKYDQLSAVNKESKIKKHYNLKENNVLTDDQINEFGYKVAIGEIDENSIKLAGTEQIKPKESNILKITGIVVLILIGGFSFILFIKKRR